MVGHAEYMDGATETASGCFLALHSTRGAAASGVRVACVRETILCVYERNEANEQSVEATKINGYDCSAKRTNVWMLFDILEMYGGKSVYICWWPYDKCVFVCVLDTVNADEIFCICVNGVSFRRRWMIQ